MTVDSPEALRPYGWSDRVIALFAGSAEPGSGLQPGRVVRVERHGAVVATRAGERPLTTSSPTAVGDWVTVDVDAAAVHDVLPRWSQVTRADPDGGVQVLAANVDLVIITAPADRLSPARVERELALAWESGARPLVALTKADLADERRAEALAARFRGVDVVSVSARTSAGLEELRAALRSVTAVLLGPSGAGKSTLANALLGVDRLATGDVRAGDSRGRHTTTTRQLVTIPGGGVLIDTPGLRSLGLAGGSGVDQAFPEIEELAPSCRFTDCRHDAEPGCAVGAALAAGELDPARLTNYRKLTREVAAERRRSDPLVRREELRLWKQRAKVGRLHAKRTGR